VWDDLADGARQAARGDGLQIGPVETMHAIQFALQMYGSEPVCKLKNPPEEHEGPQLLGFLLACAPPTILHEILDELEHVVAAGVCPAMVGLIGPGASGGDTYSGVWPLLPLAKYFATVERELIESEEAAI
jgi:hypothetical protein